MAEINIDGVVTWLKNWFYDKTEIGNLLNTKANLNQNQANYNVVTDGSGNITVEAKPTIPTDVSDLTDTQNTTFTPKSHNHGNLSNDGKVGSNANYFVTTTTGGAITSKQKIGNITTSGAIGSTANKPLITTTNGVITTGSFGTTANTFCQGNDSRLSDARTPIEHNQSTTTIINDNSYTHIGVGANTTQNDVNDAIDTKLGQLSSIEALVMVDTLPTATASTMGKLYVINENSKINFYWTKRSGTSGSYTYAWEKMDTDILDELVVDWSDVQNKPSTFTPSSHTHSADDVSDSTAHSNIGSSANATQSTINSSIDTSLSNKGAKTDDVDWTYSSNGFTNGVKLVSKTDNANGRITLHLKS